MLDTPRSVLRQRAPGDGAPPPRPPLLDGLTLPDHPAGDRGRPGRISWRPLLAACSAFLFLGLAAERLGIVLAAAGAFLLATLAEPRPPLPLAGALHAGAIATLGWLIFSRWLGLDLPIAPDF